MDDDKMKNDSSLGKNKTLMIIFVCLFVFVYSYTIYDRFFVFHETPPERVKNADFYENIEVSENDYISVTKLDVYEELDKALESVIEYDEDVHIGYLTRDYNFNKFYKITAGKNTYKIELIFSGNGGAGCINNVGYISRFYNIKINGVFISFAHGGGRGSSFEAFDNKYLLMNDHSIGEIGSHVTIFDENMYYLYRFVSDGMYGDNTDNDVLYTLENSEMTYYCEKEDKESYKTIVYRVVTDYEDGYFGLSRMFETNYESKGTKAFDCLY